VRVYVTGATGFIGRHVVQRLCRAGFEVRCLVRNIDKAKILIDLGAEVVQGDVTNRATLAGSMQGCEAVVHLANVYSMWLLKGDEFERVNITGTRSVVECACDAGIEKFVYVSTVAVYGVPEERPFTETSAPGKRMLSRYARSKAEGNRIAWQVASERNLPLVVLYPGIVLGAGDDKASGQYIQDIIFRRVPSTIFHSSKAVYVYVEDLAECIYQALVRPEAAGQRYLIGRECLDGKSYAQMISSVAGVKLPWFHFPDPIVILASYLFSAIARVLRRSPWWGLSVDAAWTLSKGFVFDGRKAERELGVSYVPIRLALEEAVRFYRERASGRLPGNSNPSQHQ